MNKENCALKLVDEIIPYYDTWSKKHKKTSNCILQSNVPEDGHNYCPKHVKLTLEC